MPKATRTTNDPPSLSKKEEIIVSMIFQGVSGRELARGLNISEWTMKNHMQSIFNKLGCSNILELFAMAHQQNAIQLWTCFDITYHPELYGEEPVTPEEAQHRRRRERLVQKYDLPK